MNQTQRKFLIERIQKGVKSQIQNLKDSKLKILDIKELAKIAYSFTGIHTNTQKRDKIIGVVEDRTLEVIDYIYQK